MADGKIRRIYAVETPRGVLLEGFRRKNDAEKEILRQRRKGVKAKLEKYTSKPS